jgi:hypothetical protein
VQTAVKLKTRRRIARSARRLTNAHDPDME